MNYPSTRLVFDRKNTATKDVSALIQIEVLFERRKKYISTGVRVYKNQFDKKKGIVNNRFDMVSLNAKISALKGRVDNFILGLINNAIPFTFDALSEFLEADTERAANFVDFVERKIKNRTDIRDTTKRTQMKLVGVLADFGKIKTTADLTKRNIILFDEYLHAKGIKQSTIHSYHKVLKTYIHEAMKLELISADPYLAISISRGESEQGRYLSDKEFMAVRDAKLPTDSLSRVRDLFLLQCYTGLAYSDLMAFDFSKVKINKNIGVLSDNRHKTGVGFTTILMPEALDVVKKYKGVLPKISNEKYNQYLKVVAAAAGIEKPIASHWGRRTCGMLLLNRGVSMEVVSKVLGHSSIKTTEAVYAKILRETVVREVVDKLL